MATRKRVSTFSLNETVTPKFNTGQIHVDSSKRVMDYGLPKPTRKLTVGRSGKVGYSK